MAFYGLNVDSFCNWELLYPVVLRLRPSLMVVYANDGSGIRLASILKDLSEHPTNGWPMTTMVRWPDDNGMHSVARNADPRELVRARVAQTNDSRLVLYLNNEPLGDDQRFVEWSIATMEEGHELGYKVAFGGWPVTWPTDEQITTTFRPAFLKAIELGCPVHTHEYGAMHMTDHPMSPWLIGPVRRILAAYPDLDPGNVFLTEVGLDHIEQVPESGSWQQIGLSEEAYGGQLAGARVKVYRPLKLGGGAVFEYSEQGTFFSRGYSVAHKPALLACLEESEPTPEPTPEPGDLAQRLATVETSLVWAVRDIEELRQQNERLEKRLSALTLAAHAAGDALKQG